MTEPLVTSVTLGPMPKSLFDPLPTVRAQFSDGTEKCLFSYFPDEISFTESELVGLTEKQVWELRTAKDLAYFLPWESAEPSKEQSVEDANRRGTTSGPPTINVTVGVFVEGASAPLRTWPIRAEQTESFIEQKRQEGRQLGGRYTVRVIPETSVQPADIQASETQPQPPPARPDADHSEGETGDSHAI